MADKIDGFYAAYMTGSDGNGFVMFAFLNGVVVGVDPLGVRFDGQYRVGDEGYIADVHVTIPAGGTVIQGASAGPAGLAYDVQLNLPADLDQSGFMRVDTPLGPVNVRLQKLRDMGSLT